jgi:ABC-type glycerol-3-phosphate transport system substrate-binding protein
MRAEAQRLVAENRVPFGLVWQGARYEGLVTVFLEYLTAFGGRIFDEHGRVMLHEPAAVRALTFMCEGIRSATTPPSVLTWQEEQTRLVFQNGAAAFMRNWPYAWPLMQNAADSRVANRFAVTSVPAADGAAADGGRPSAALGGAQLAVNARSRHPDLAGALVAYLTDAAQMRERATRAGQLPARRSLYDDETVMAAFGIPADDLRRVVDTAVARPVTPVYTELSEILQVRLHQALSGQLSAADALRDAAREVDELMIRTSLGPSRSAP